MQVKIWTLHADDDLGPRTYVHTTQEAAYLHWVNLQFPDESDEDDLSNRSVAARFINRQDFDGLSEWMEGGGFSEPFDAYAIEGHNVEISSPTGSQLNSV